MSLRPVPDEEKIGPQELDKALRFFSVLSKYSFVCLVDQQDTGFHLFTKGEPDEVEELMEVLRNAR